MKLDVIQNEANRDLLVGLPEQDEVLTANVGGFGEVVVAQLDFLGIGEHIVSAIKSGDESIKNGIVTEPDEDGLVYFLSGISGRVTFRLRGRWATARTYKVREVAPGGVDSTQEPN